MDNKDLIRQYRADVIPFPCVSCSVSLKVRLLHEGFSAVSANKLLFAFVVPQVILEG